jgi:hypothetical protein
VQNVDYIKFHLFTALAHVHFECETLSAADGTKQSAQTNVPASWCCDIETLSDRLQLCNKHVQLWQTNRIALLLLLRLEPPAWEC